VLLRHILAALVLVAFGIIGIGFSVRTWRQPLEPMRLGDTSGEALNRGIAMPFFRSMVCSSTSLTFIGLFLVAVSIERYSHNQMIRDSFWILYFLFLAVAVVFALLAVSIFFTGVPRALIPPRFRVE